MEIGSIIKNARNEAGLTQEQAAEALCVSRQTISNWENGKTFPDIISVIKMSDLYSVSLDHLLKEETSMKKSYKDYLSESTDTVKSRERQSMLILTLVTLGIWALAVIAFWLVKDIPDSAGYSLAVTWAVLPILFFAASCFIGHNGYFGRLKWLAAPLFGAMYALSGSIVTLEAENVIYRSVVWPDLTKLPVGFLIAIAGLVFGILLRRREKSARDAADE